MNPVDIIYLGFSNLWRTKLRTILTTLGVTIGIGALVSMVSFGTGMQKNVSETFYENDLFTSMQVTPGKVNLDDALSGNPEAAAGAVSKDTPPLDDAAIASIQNLPGVDIAFPEIRFPVRIHFEGNETKTMLRALPAEMARYKPYRDIPYGRFFGTDSSRTVLVSQSVLRDLKILLPHQAGENSAFQPDTSLQYRMMPADSLLGQNMEIITSVIDLQAVIKNPYRVLAAPDKTPIKESSIILPVGGILKSESAFGGGNLSGGILISVKTAESIPRMGFSNVWSLLDRSPRAEGHQSVYVRLKSMNDLEEVRSAIEAMGHGVISIADQFEEMKKGFLLFDAALGTVGTIALIVAALGIINTMVMTILERTREIGVMKAIGGSENEIKAIFVVEAACIGLAGGVMGIVLGFLVTRIANFMANYYFLGQGVELLEPVNFFYIPLWLILGALGFAVAVSLLAGIYPANRAARIDPVKALRHD